MASLNDLMKKLSGFFANVNPAGDTNPQLPGRQNYWTGAANNAVVNIGRSPVGQALVGAQHLIESPKSLNPIPSVTPFRGNNLASNAGNFAANIPGMVGNSIASPLLNIGSDFAQTVGRTIGGRGAVPYQNLKSPISRLEYNALGVNRTPQQVIGNIAGTGADALNYLMPGAAKNAVGESVGLAGKRVLPIILKNSLKETVPLFAAQGGLSGLSEGRNATNLPKQLASGAVGAGTGAALGALLGTGSALGGAALGTIKNNVVKMLMQKHGLSEANAAKVTDSFWRDELGRFVGKNQQGSQMGFDIPNLIPSAQELGKSGKALGEKTRADIKTSLGKPATEPIYYGDIREMVGLPRSGNYQSGFIKPDEFLPKQAEPQLPDQTPPVAQSGINKIGQTQEPALPGFVQDFKNQVNKLYTEAIDRYHPLSSIAKNAGEDQAMRNALTHNYGAGSTANYHVDYELSPILKSVDANDLRDYTIAQRDFELAARGIQGSDRGEAARVMEKLDQKYGGNLNQLDAAANKLYDYQKNLVKQYLVGTGVISQDVYDKMLSQNQRYVPFKRVMDEVDNFLGTTPQQKGVGSVGSQSVIQKIKGSKRQIHDPLESIIENTYKIVGLGRRNQVARTIASLQNQLPEIIKPFEGEIGHKPVISVLENGKAKKYLVPQDVAEAAKGLSEESLNTIVKILSQPTKLLRATATGLNPEFMLPNIVRDYQSAFVNAGLNPLGFAQGLAHMLGRDQVYQDFLKAGGKTSSVSIDRPFLKKTVADITSTKAGIDFNQLRHPISMLQTLGELSEQPTRIAVFNQYLQRGLKQGLSKDEAMVRAANMAQDATVNFARRGSKNPSCKCAGCLYQC
jgi:hypothetical protein